MKGFTKLEEAVLLTICGRSSDDQAVLDSQLETASVRNRNNTGAGFYTHFDVSKKTLPLHQNLLDDVWASVKGFAQPMGFILWLKGGYADHLEGFTIADSTAGLDLSALTFEVLPHS